MSTGNIVEDNYYHTQIKDVTHSTIELLFRGKNGYGYLIYPDYPNIVIFPLENPEYNYSLLGETISGDYLIGGTYSCELGEWGWLLTQYGNGLLYQINIITGEMASIGGGGNELSDIAWDDSTSTLYGIKDYIFYKIDPETGKQFFLGYCDVSLLGIAFNSDRNCFGIGYEGTNYNLYKIDITSFGTKLVGPLTNFSSQYYPEPEFDKDNDILYLWNGNSLYICDIETCECIFIGQIDLPLITAFTIPYGIPPVTTISFAPPEPDGCNGWYVSNVTVTFNATDDEGVNATYFRINTSNWEIYSDPFILSEDGDDILIEYYSVDIIGSVEDVKSTTIDIDRTPPYVNLTYEVLGWSPLEGWEFQFTAFVKDNCSGAGDRVEFYFNNELMETVSGSGPEYVWTFCYYPLSGTAIFRVTAQNGACLFGTDEIINPKTSSQNVQYLWFFDRFPVLEVFLRLMEILR